MPGVLLEREEQLGRLESALAAAEGGRGRVVAVGGEAGIGKTSLIRAFCAAHRRSGRVRVLLGACDHLSTPRTLGPLRDVAAQLPPLARAMAAPAAASPPAPAGGADEVYDVLLREFAAAPATLLVLEDVHWADDATLDLVRVIGHRIDGLHAVVVLTYRDDALPARHPMRRLLGDLATSALTRLELAPLSPGSVDRLAAHAGRDATGLHARSGGNPFFVTELLAAPQGCRLPPTIVDAVQGRVRLLSPACQGHLERLSVVPSAVDLGEAREILSTDVAALGEAEALGILEVRGSAIGFRHELARQAVEAALPELTRRSHNRRVLSVLRSAPSPDVARIVHHALAAGDADTVARSAPRAGREASAAGSHRQALEHFGAAVAHAQYLDAAERARVLEEYAWELYNAHRFAEAVQQGRRAVALREQIGLPVPLAEALVRQSRHLFMAGAVDDAWLAIERAADIALTTSDARVSASARTYRGAMHALLGRAIEAELDLDAARGLAQSIGRADLVALCRNYLGMAGAELGRPDAVSMLRSSLALALEEGLHEEAARAYTNLGELLYREQRWVELEQCLIDGLAFAHQHDFWSHAFNLEVHRALLAMHRGAFDEALAIIRRTSASVEDPGMLFVYSAPVLGLLQARRGDPAGADLLLQAWRRSRAQHSLLGMTYAGLGLLELAWLEGRPALAVGVADVLLDRCQAPGLLGVRGATLRALYRLDPQQARLRAEGLPVPQPYAALLAGDAVGAAAQWSQAGSPYDAALDLLTSDDAAAIGEALSIVQLLDVRPAVHLAQQRLRQLGVLRIPRGPSQTTRAHPDGLTSRQVDVLELLAEGLSNAEIAERLVLSVRTVEHHVSAILAKLGAEGRRTLRPSGPFR